MNTDPTREIIEANTQRVMATDDISPEGLYEWRRARKTGIGGSDVAAALGLSPYKGPYSLFVEKRDPDVEDIDNERMEMGRRLEGPIIEAFADREQLRVMRYPFMVRSLKWPFALANLDGYAPMAVVEAKNVGLRMADEWADGQVPDHYSLQGQTYCGVTGLDRVIFVVLIGGQELRSVVVERDDLLIEEMMERLAAFWKLVESDTPPSTEGPGSKEALARRFAQTVDTPTAVGPEVLDWLAHRRLLKAQLAATELELERYENAIKASLGHHTEGTLDGETIVTWRSHDVRRVNTKLLTKLYPDVDRAVRVAKPERRLHVPDTKSLALRATELQLPRGES